MLKALFRKQTLEALSFLFKSSKEGKRRSTGSIILYSFLMIYVIGVMGWMFWSVSSMLCAPLVGIGLDWLYFAIMSLTATVFGVFFSVFATQSQLFEAKDNELLLSMPILPSMLLLSRMLTLYVQTFFFEALVLLPAIIVYYPLKGLSLAGILLLFVLPFAALALSCILGWLVALISSRLKNKSLISVLLSLIFLAVYLWCYSQINNYLNFIVTNAALIGKRLKGVFPLYQLGNAFTGDIGSLAVFVLTAAVFFGAVYAVLSLSFIKIVTAKKGGVRRKYVKKELTVAGFRHALLKKEFMRFRSSPAYMMNCSLGSIFMLIGAVYIFIKGKSLAELIYSLYPGCEYLVPLLACAAVCLILTMNNIAAPSVSLEGKNLWILKSLPVKPLDILTAKIKLHLYITVPFSVFLCAAVSAALRPDAVSALMIFIIPILFSVFTALFGLILNLKFPNFTWSNETAAVKQSVSVTVAIFGGFGVLIVFGGLYYLLHGFVSVGAFMALSAALIAVLCVFLWLWIVKRGTRVFELL